jgi:hypothetical protein
VHEYALRQSSIGRATLASSVLAEVAVGVVHDARGQVRADLLQLERTGADAARAQIGERGARAG